MQGLAANCPKLDKLGVDKVGTGVDTVVWTKPARLLRGGGRGGWCSGGLLARRLLARRPAQDSGQEDIGNKRGAANATAGAGGPATELAQATVLRRRWRQGKAPAERTVSDKGVKALAARMFGDEGVKALAASCPKMLGEEGIKMLVASCPKMLGDEGIQRRGSQGAGGQLPQEARR